MTNQNILFLQQVINIPHTSMHNMKFPLYLKSALVSGIYSSNFRFIVYSLKLSL